VKEAKGPGPLPPLRAGEFGVGVLLVFVPPEPCDPPSGANLPRNEAGHRERLPLAILRALFVSRARIVPALRGVHRPGAVERSRRGAVPWTSRAIGSHRTHTPQCPGRQIFREGRRAGARDHYLSSPNSVFSSSFSGHALATHYSI